MSDLITKLREVEQMCRDWPNMALNAWVEKYCPNDRDKWTTEAIADRLAAIIGEMEKPRPTVVCLCGSTRFVDAFMEAYGNETDAGKIVLSVGRFKPVHGWDEAKKAKLDELHKRKIDLADEVLILNVGGYIGSSTASELAYAREHGKMIRFLEPEASGHADTAASGASPASSASGPTSPTDVCPNLPKAGPQTGKIVLSDEDRRKIEYVIAQMNSLSVIHPDTRIGSGVPADASAIGEQLYRAEEECRKLREDNAALSQALADANFLRTENDRLRTALQDKPRVESVSAKELEEVFRVIEHYADNGLTLDETFTKRLTSTIRRFASRLADLEASRDDEAAARSVLRGKLEAEQKRIKELEAKR